MIKNLLQLLSIIFLFTGQAFGENRHAVVVVEQTHGTVAFYDSEGWRRLGEVKVGLNPHEIALTSDSRTAYVTNFGVQDYDETIGHPGSTVSEILVSSMVETRLFSTKPDLAPHGVKLRPGHERELYVNTEKPARMIVFDVDTGTVKRRFNVDLKTHNFVFSADGAILWLMAGPSGVLAVDPESGQVLAQHLMSSPVRGLALSSDQTTLVASGKDEIELLDAANLALKKRFTGFGVGQILYAVPSPDGRYIVAPAVWDSSILVIDMHSGALVRRFTSGLDPVAVAYSPDGGAVYVSNARGHTLTKLDLSTMTTSQMSTMQGPNGVTTSTIHLDTNVREHIVFAAVLPLSGRDATFGREMELGYELWKNDVNARGGIYVADHAYLVDTMYLDTGSDSQRVKDLARQAIEQGAKFLLGSYGSPDNAAAASVASEFQIPMVTAAGAARNLYQQGNRFLFGIMAPASQYLIGSMDVAMSATPKPKRVIVLASDAPAPLEDAQNAARYGHAQGIGFATLSAEVLRDLGLTQDPSGAIVYRQGVRDFSAIISALALIQTDFLVVAGDLSDSMSWVRAAKTIAFRPYGFAFSVGPSVPQFASPMGLGDAANGMIGATQWSPSARIEGLDRYGSASAFAAGFWDAYNARASYLSAGAYASGLVFEHALAAAESIDSHAVRDSMASMDLNTFYGRIRFNEFGLNDSKPIYTIQLDVHGSNVEERLLRPLEAGAVDPIWPLTNEVGGG